MATSRAVVERFDHGVMSSIKALSESSNLASLPLSHNFAAAVSVDDDEDDVYQYNNLSSSSSSLLPENQIPVIDFSLLTSNSHLIRSKAIQELADACQNWGFFQVINHGVEESLMKGMIEKCEEFFNLTEEEKQKNNKGKDVLDPIRYGTSFNTSVDQVLFWRDFLKVFVHPDFHSPENPPSFGEVSDNYCRQVRGLARVMMRAICEGLGLGISNPWSEMEETSFQILIANFYPPCPQPELAMGLPSHSDHGFLTVLAQNGVDGLQLKRNGKWVDVHGLPNSFLVNTADHLEILSNGRYKSIVHRAVVNGNATRMSVAVANGPSLDAVVEPASELVDDGKRGCHSPHYMGMRYRDYMRLQQSNQLDNKSCLDRVRL